MIDIDAARERLTAAIRELDALCAGRRQWKMSVPANEERDSDLVFARSLCDLKSALDELAGLRARRAAETSGVALGGDNAEPVMVVHSFDRWIPATREQVEDAGAMPQFVADMIADAQGRLDGRPASGD